ncbi:MAG TPA: hypothetical protein VMB83_01320 [Roseiarcus sp.]|nr:hypothetical protein [Roseiarcus sp.]
MTAHVLRHPTNIAFDGATLYSANLGRWRITKIATDTAAVSLASRASAIRREVLKS